MATVGVNGFNKPVTNKTVSLRPLQLRRFLIAFAYN